MRFKIIACSLFAVAFAAGVVVVAQSPAPVLVPTYNVDPTWPQLPNNWVIGDPSSIAVDRHDHVWILHRPRTVPPERKDRAAPPVLEFDQNGKFVQAWGGQSDKYEWPDTEHGIYVDRRDQVWIGGNNGTPIIQVKVSPRNDDMLTVFTRSGKFVKQIGHRDQSKGGADTANLHQPADVFVDKDEVFVADGYGNRRVIVFDAKTGVFKRMWGAFGNKPEDGPLTPGTPQADGRGPAQFAIVHALKVSNDGLVYVADRPNRRVQVFTRDGRFVAETFINKTAKGGNTACGLALSQDKEQKFLFVSDFGNQHIVVLDRRTLKTLTQFGNAGKEPGNFQNAHHIALDSKNNLYTAEVSPGSRVQRFRFQGLAPVPVAR